MKKFVGLAIFIFILGAARVVLATSDCPKILRMTVLNGPQVYGPWESEMRQKVMGAVVENRRVLDARNRDFEHKQPLSKSQIVDEMRKQILKEFSGETLPLMVGFRVDGFHYPPDTNSFRKFLGKKLEIIFIDGSEATIGIGDYRTDFPEFRRLFDDLDFRSNLGRSGLGNTKREMGGVIFEYPSGKKKAVKFTSNSSFNHELSDMVKAMNGAKPENGQIRRIYAIHSHPDSDLYDQLYGSPNQPLPSKPDIEFGLYLKNGIDKAGAYEFNAPEDRLVVLVLPQCSDCRGLYFKFVP